MAQIAYLRFHKAMGHDEYREAAHRGLMRSYALLGERGRAIEHSRILVDVLRDGLWARRMRPRRGRFLSDRGEEEV